MNARLLSKRFALAISLSALAIAIAAILCAGLCYDLEDTLLSRQTPQPLLQNWYSVTPLGEIALNEPSRPAANCLDQTLTLRTTLPAQYLDNLSVLFQTKNETVRVFIDDQLIYVYGETPQRAYGHGVGSLWNMAALPADSQGKQMTVELTPIGGSTGLAPYCFMLGSHDGLLNWLLYLIWPSILAVVLLSLIGLTSLMFSIITRIRKDTRSGSTFHFGVFVLFSAIWMATDSGLMQFICPDKGVSYMLFGCSFYLICTPFALFISQMLPSNQKMFRALAIVNSLYAAVRIILYVTGTLDFEAALWMLHLIMAVLILSTNIILLRSLKNNKQSDQKELFIATSVLSLIAGIAIVFYYAGDKIHIQRNGYSSGFYLGIILFVVIVVIGVSKKSLLIRQQAFKAAFFERRAYTDELTGLLNVKGFDDKCAAILKSAPENICYAVIDFDVNFFSQYNANNGLDAGDDLLRQIADILRDFCRADELCARQESDHFVCLVWDNTIEDVLSRIRVADQTVREELSEKMLLISYGVAEVFNRDLSPATLRNHALVAKHTIKGNYEQNIALYNYQLHQAQLEEIELLSSFDAALQNNEYVIFLQPKVDAATEKLSGAEALVRRVLKDGGITSAWTIIKTLESKGFVAKLDYYILEKVCQFQRRCLDEGRQVFPVSSNFSRVHLYDPDFPTRISEIVDRYALPHELIEVELTETNFLVGKDTLQTMVSRLHDQGFCVAIDDFGSGYSSLNMLKDVDVDIIKLDREFLTGGTENARAGAIIGHTLRLAQEMKIVTVAEGVESADQLAFLRSMGCDQIQGYYFSKPIPENEFVEKYLMEA